MHPFKKKGHIAWWQTQRPWLIAALLSLLVHSALLYLVDSRPTAGSQGLARRTLHATLRLMEPAAALPAGPAPQEQAKPPAPPALKNTASEPADTPPPGPMQEGNAATLDAHYFAPDELTAEPVFLRDKRAPSPTFIPDVLPLPVLAYVYIDEHGDVVQVVLGDNFLSEIARSFIVDSFLATQFTPGMLGSLAVKSMLTVEVKLDPALPVR